MYESDDIIKYMFNTYGGGEAEIPGLLTAGFFTTLSAGLGNLGRYLRVCVCVCVCACICVCMRACALVNIWSSCVLMNKKLQRVLPSCACFIMTGQALTRLLMQ